jgi:tRNA U34 5-methylaminomethyl-2-thiouridine-forming methyltransferase MnmC
MKLQIKTTADGSSTLYRSDLNEYFHSINGAVQESMHVFIGAGLNSCSGGVLNILEAGFGTGLNALLTMLESGTKRTINYHAVELHPLDWNLAGKLGYDIFLGLTDVEANLFREMHRSPWDENTFIRQGFYLRKMKVSFTEVQLRSRYHLVYFDAFAPSVQPELWSEDIFRKLEAAMQPGGVLVTYCARGEVRRNMQKAGLIVERLPGAPGKREMLRAKKTGT